MDQRIAASAPYIYVFSPSCRAYLEKLKSTQKGRPNPAKAFRKDENMRLFKVFQYIEHGSA